MVSLSLALSLAYAEEPSTPADGEGAAAHEPTTESEPPTLAEQYPVEYPGQCTPDQDNFDLEILYYESRYKEGLALAEQRLAQAPTAQLYWMKARFLYEIGEEFERDDPSIDKEAHYQKMLDASDAGLALAPGDLHLRFARGIAMGRLGTTRGVLRSLFMAKDVESDWLAAATATDYAYSSIGGRELLPCDAQHAIGIYYRLVPDWWIVQVLAGTRGDLHKSVDWHSKAVKCKPNEPANWLELGVTQLCVGQHEKDQAMLEAGRASLRKAQSLHAENPRMKIDVRNAGRVLADESMACEYSRDGQQDLDESKLQK